MEECKFGPLLRSPPSASNALVLILSIGMLNAYLIVDDIIYLRIFLSRFIGHK